MRSDKDFFPGQEEMELPIVQDNAMESEYEMTPDELADFNYSFQELEYEDPLYELSTMDM